MLREDQISNIEDDKELNEAIQTMSWLKYRAMVDALKPPNLS